MRRKARKPSALAPLQPQPSRRTVRNVIAPYAFPRSRGEGWDGGCFDVASVPCAHQLPHNASRRYNQYHSLMHHMRKQYDFSASRKNPYAAQLKKPVTIRLDQDSITYFKSMADETGIPYQSLINLYLKDCASLGKKLNLAWK